VTLEGIDSVEDFVEKLERIEAPGQMVSFLTDPLLQKYVELSDLPIIAQRIHLWLSMCLEDQYIAIKEGIVDSRYFSDVLDGLLKHAQYTKVGPISLAHPETILTINRTCCRLCRRF
jgi:centromere protein I